jgi:uncharacterized protein YdeI (BOF family)
MKAHIISLLIASTFVSTSSLVYSEFKPETPPTNLEAKTAPEGTISIKDVKRGQAVILHGTITRIKDEDEFVLTDDSGRIEIYLPRIENMPYKVDEAVTVHGKADDDVLPGIRPDIYASKIISADGTVRTFKSWD